MNSPRTQTHRVIYESNGCWMGESLCAVKFEVNELEFSFKSIALSFDFEQGHFISLMKLMSRIRSHY